MKKTNPILASILICFMLVVVAILIPARTDIAIALMVEMGVEDLARDADSVLRGEVTGIKSEWDEGKSKIYTYITLSVKERIKGGATEDTVTIRQLGGKVGKMRLTVSDSAVFNKGENLIVFLKSEGVQRSRRRRAINKIVGMEQGKYSIARDSLTGRHMVTVGKGTFATGTGAIVSRAGRQIVLEDFIGQIKRVKGKHKQ